MPEQRRLEAMELQQVATALADLPSEEGIRKLQELIEAYPNDGKLIFLRGSLYADLRQYDAALEDFERSVALDPEFAIGRFQCGLLLFSSGQAERAREVWSSLDRLDDGDCLSLFKRGLCALLDGRPEDGLALLRAGQAANQAFPPLNADMQRVIERVVQEAGMQATAEEGDRSTHVLLKGYVPTTKH